MQQPWHPILEGDLYHRAESHLQAIVASMQAEAPPADPGLADGLAGLSVLWAYLGAGFGGDGARSRARALLERASEALTVEVLRPGVFAGFTGVAWAYAHLARRFLDDSEPDAAAGIDAAVADFVEQTPWTRDYDLMSGLVGLGVYALERLPGSRATDILELIVRRLHELAQSSPAGITWHTPPPLLPPLERVNHPGGYYNLGVAHGVPGVIALLAAACAHGVGRDTAPRLLEGAVDWLWSQRLPDAEAGCFATITEGPTRHEPARLAWCYGDAGIAGSLAAAAAGLDLPSLRRLSAAVARRAVARNPGTAGVVDAGLCHGAAGLAHVFNRLFHFTGDEDCLGAARAWFLRTLELRRDDVGVAGYPSWRLGRDGRYAWHADPGLLTGAAGVALALLAATSNLAPDWDRVLLLSFRPPGA